MVRKGALPHVSVPNWKQFQHYKDRRPIWIKSYVEVLRDYKFSQLDDHSQQDIMQIWLLAAELDNKIPLDEPWLTENLPVHHHVRLKPLIDHGFLQGDSTMIAEFYQDDSRFIARCYNRDSLEKEKDVPKTSYSFSKDAHDRLGVSASGGPAAIDGRPPYHPDPDEHPIWISGYDGDNQLHYHQQYEKAAHERFVERYTRLQGGMDFTPLDDWIKAYRLSWIETAIEDGLASEPVKHVRDVRESLELLKNPHRGAKHAARTSRTG
jgi:hypothetical protein